MARQFADGRLEWTLLKYFPMQQEHLREVKSATILRFKDLWKRNFLANLDSIQRNPGVAALNNKFNGVPCIVVGAGPSLDKNIRLLGQARDKAVIIASDAALKPLLANDIIPSFVACLDPQEEITKFLKGVPHRGITLIAPSIIHPHVLEIWDGEVIFYNKFAPDIPVLTEIQKQIPQIGTLTPGGTVLTIAYHFAFMCGGNPILFVGQDLSYPKNKTYSRESENMEQNLENTLQLQREHIVLEKDMNGRTLPTLKSMWVSKQWFNWAFTTWKRKDAAEIINCSEAGILTDHCKLMPLSEALFRFCGKKVNVAWILKKSLKKKK